MVECPFSTMLVKTYFLRKYVYPKPYHVNRSCYKQKFNGGSWLRPLRVMPCSVEIPPEPVSLENLSGDYAGFS